jgi:hypothetical protein
MNLEESGYSWAGLPLMNNLEKPVLGSVVDRK